MEITRDALLRVIKAARTAMKMAEVVQKFAVCSGRWTLADEISGNLTDALFLMNREELTAKQDFERDSVIMEILRGDMSDGAIADYLIIKNRIYDKYGKDLETVSQPAPNLISKEELEKLHMQCGGYSPKTPEGE